MVDGAVIALGGTSSSRCDRCALWPGAVRGARAGRVRRKRFMVLLELAGPPSGPTMYYKEPGTGTTSWVGAA